MTKELHAKGSIKGRRKEVNDAASPAELADACDRRRMLVAASRQRFAQTVRVHLLARQDGLYGISKKLPRHEFLRNSVDRGKIDTARSGNKMIEEPYPFADRTVVRRVSLEGQNTPGRKDKDLRFGRCPFGTRKRIGKEPEVIGKGRCLFFVRSDDQQRPFALAKELEQKKGPRAPPEFRDLYVGCT
jgi:hypothetical protein